MYQITKDITYKYLAAQKTTTTKSLTIVTRRTINDIINTLNSIKPKSEKFGSKLSSKSECAMLFFGIQLSTFRRKNVLIKDVYIFQRTKSLPPLLRKNEYS